MLVFFCLGWGWGFVVDLLDWRDRFLGYCVGDELQTLRPDGAQIPRCLFPGLTPRATDVPPLRGLI